MLKETEKTAKTVDLAVAAACEALGVSADEVDVTVIDEPKKGILGIGAQDAKVLVALKRTPAVRAVEFVETLVSDMGLEAEVRVTEKNEEGITLSVEGKDLGMLIGRRGDVLDAVQYLANLAANTEKNGFYRVTVDVQGYREKRAETLRGVARRMSEKVLKYKRSFALEPMNAYERRIIHAECQNIAGVTTRSAGEGIMMASMYELSVMNVSERKIIISIQKDQ